MSDRREFPRRPTAETVAAVQDYLNESGLLIGAKIRCEVADERIVLRGYVSTYSMKCTARTLAERIADCRVEERLDVIPIPPDHFENRRRTTR